LLQDTASIKPSDSALSNETLSNTRLSNEESNSGASTDDTTVASALENTAVVDSTSIDPYTAPLTPTASRVEPQPITPNITTAMGNDESAAGLPASRKDRWWAAVIDMVLQILASLPFIWFIGLEAFKNPTPQLALANSANALLVYLVLHGYLLHKYGQTIGKAEYGMRIEMLNGEKASFQHIILWRYLPILVLSFVPLIGQLIVGLINPLLIFRQDRRCLHDHIAGTQVRYCYREQQADTTTAVQSGDTDAPDTPVAATAKPEPDQLQ